MTGKQLRRILAQNKISESEIAGASGYALATISKYCESRSRLAQRAQRRIADGVLLVLDKRVKGESDSIVWRFTERDRNAEKRRGFGGQNVKPDWVPTTLYPIIQFCDENLPRPPADMRWALRGVIEGETAVQAFDRLIDTDSKPIRWREAEPMRLAA